MFNEKNAVIIEVEDFRELVAENRDLDNLKRILWEKLKSYGGIKHEELKLICTVFGIDGEAAK